MIEVILQTSEVPEQGYIFVLSESNDKNNDRLITELFQKIDVNRFENDKTIIEADSIFWIKKGIQTETNRNCESVLVINGIETNKLSSENKEKINLILTRFFNESFPKIIDDCKQNNRRIIYNSVYLTALEANLEKSNLPVRLATSGKSKSHAGNILGGTVLGRILSLIMLGIVVWFGVNGVGNLFKSSEENIPENKVVILDDIAQRLNCKEFLQEWKKEENIEHLLRYKGNKEKYISNPEKWPFVLCELSSYGLESFYDLKQQNAYSPEYIIACRKWNYDFYTKVDALLQFIHENYVERQSISQLLQENKNIGDLYAWIESANDIFIDKRNNYQVFAPVFNDKDINMFLTVDKFIRHSNTSFISIRKRDENKFASMSVSSNFKLIARLLAENKFSDHMNNLKIQINSCKGDYTNHIKDIEALIKVVDYVIEMVNCFNKIPNIK